MVYRILTGHFKGQRLVTYVRPKKVTLDFPDSEVPNGHDNKEYVLHNEDEEQFNEDEERWDEAG